MTGFPQAPDWVRTTLRDGAVIPAHPLALTREGQLDERPQRALSRYYHAAGSGGIAVGVHTSQFAIREPKHALRKPVLALAAETIAACDAASGRRTLLIGGLCGRTEQAVAEAQLARQLGYHAGLLSLAALREASHDELIAHCETAGWQPALPDNSTHGSPFPGARLPRLPPDRALVGVPRRRTRC